MRKALLCFFVPLLALAGTVTRTFTFSPDEVKFTEANGYDLADLRGYVSTSAPGEPILPQAILTFVVPPNGTVTSVVVASSEKVELPGTYLLHPAQMPRPLSARPEPEFVGPDDAVYGSSGTYPGKLVEFGYTGTKTGYRLCGVSAFPLQYTPSTGKVTLYTSLTLKVTYDDKALAAAPVSRVQRDVAGQELRSFVANSEDIAKFAPALRQSDVTDAEYVIITSESYVSTLQPLADWLSRKGFTTVFKTTSWITSTYSGYDTQEKVRNFIIDYYANHGTMWVLLAGAHSVIPARRGRSVVSSSTGNIPADLYYSDLQWSWDGDGDHIYGEAGDDTVDFYADVYVGRAPINSEATAQTFVNKVFGYEKAPDTGYIRKAYLPWVNLFSGYTGEAVSDTIAGITPAGWTDIKAPSPSRSAFQSAINSGYGVCHAAAHGDVYGFYTDQGSPIYTTTEAAAQTNGLDKLVVLNSMACISGNFENQGCLSVTLQNNANGGSVANMMNSRYGWGTPPSMGPSEKLCVRFYDFFIEKDSWMLGVAHARGKDVYAALPQTKQVWRWCFYDYNLLGEPVMGVWSDVPGSLVVTAPDSVPTGASNVHVNVASGGPVNGAWVGLYKPGEACTRAQTNAAGDVDILISVATPGWLYVTAYAQDKLPKTDSVRVYAATPAPYLDIQGTYIDDGDNHQLDPGETVDLYVTLRNIGNATATAVAGRLSESSVHITLPDSTASYGTIDAADTSHGDRYQVTAAANAPPGSKIDFTLQVTCDQDSWTPTFTLYIGIPPTPGAVVMTHDTGYCRLSVTALGSIGYDAPPPPSADAGVGFCYPKAAASKLFFSSFALGNGATYVVDRFYGNPATNYNTDFKLVDSLRVVYPPGSGDERFRCVIGDSGHAAPKGITVAQNSYMTAAAGYDDFAVLAYDIYNGGDSIVEDLYAGVFADFDVGPDTVDQAAADTVRRTMSMRQASGDNPTFGVKILEPTSFSNLSAVDHKIYVYPTDTAMTDDMKYRFLNGTIVQRNSSRSFDWSTCTAVGPVDLPVGQTYRCAFAFVAGTSAADFTENADSAQSWYDNLLGVKEHEGVTVARGAASLVCAPNPFSRTVQIRYNVPVAGRVRAQVFDVSGRTIATLADGPAAVGRVETVWKPADLANGVYLLKVLLPSGTVSQKLMLLR